MAVASFSWIIIAAVAVVGMLALVATIGVAVVMATTRKKS